MLLIRVWVFYDKKMVVALVEKHSKQIVWKLKYFFPPPIVYRIHLELFPKIVLTILTTYIYFVEIGSVVFQKKWCFDSYIFDNNF